MVGAASHTIILLVIFNNLLFLLKDSNVEELVKLELQNEQILAELQAREKELVEEKREVEKVLEFLNS